MLKDEGFGTQGLKIQVSLGQKVQFDIFKFLFLSHGATEAEGLSGWMAYCGGVFTPGSIGDVVTKRGAFGWARLDVQRCVKVLSKREDML